MNSHANDLIYNGAITYQFLKNCTNSSNQNLTIREVRTELENKSKGKILNPASFLAMAYIFFILPKETEVLKFNNLLEEIYSKIIIKKWDKKKRDNKEGEKAIVRRLRNSIAHGKVNYDQNNKEYTFFDGIKIDDFEVKIKFTDFVDMLEYFVTQWHQQNK